MRMLSFRASCRFLSGPECALVRASIWYAVPLSVLVAYMVCSLMMLAVALWPTGSEQSNCNEKQIS